MKFNTRNKIAIADSDDFECVAIDILDEFLESFTEEQGLIRYIDPEEEEEFDEDIMFIYTPKGSRLARRMIDRLQALGAHHFPDDEINVSSYAFQEF